MKDVKYYKEGAHNYLVLCCAELKENEYQKKMLERQKLKYVFSCKVRYINGLSYYYYDITSKTTISNLFSGRMWKMEDIQGVLSDYMKALDELAVYLLDESKICLHPEYIYYDYGTKKYCFLYYPEKKVETNVFRDLFDYWLDHVDGADSSAIDCLYSMYEEAENNCLGVDRIKELTGSGTKDSCTPDSSMPLGISDITMEGQDQVGVMPYEEEMLEKEPAKSRQVFYGVFAVLVLLALCGAGLVFYLFKLTQTEKLALEATIAVLGVLECITLTLMIKERDFNKRKERYDRELTKYRDSDYLIKDAPVFEEKHISDFAGRVTRKTEENPLKNEKENETTFFMEDDRYEYVLYAADRKNKVHIPLNKAPCIIGKLSGAVDYCLQDSSVSRLHAQLDREGSRYFVRDTNSTNGTYVNGLRLNPNERLEIEPGDEIRFGKLKYVFR